MADAKHLPPKPKPVPAAGQYGECQACRVQLKKDNSSKRQRTIKRSKRRCLACVTTTVYCAMCERFLPRADFDEAVYAFVGFPMYPVIPFSSIKM